LKNNQGRSGQARSEATLDYFSRISVGSSQPEGIMENFRTLNLALTFHEECQKMTFANYVLKNQFDRALLSISHNPS
jgi:hypothetical protein